jgi:hypothetical protein
MLARASFSVMRQVKNTTDAAMTIASSEKSERIERTEANASS